MRDEERLVGRRTKPTPNAQRDAHQGFQRPPAGRKDSRWGFRGKTVWDWLQLLIVPLALVLIGLGFSIQQETRQQQIENQRAERERELEEQRAQDEALQAYLDQMSQLLLEADLRNSEEDSEVRTLAQARTATVIQRLDAKRNRSVIRFLKEARLAGNIPDSISLLEGTDLQGANFEGVDLTAVNLNQTDLSSATLRGATLPNTTLSGATLRDTDLGNADLFEANFSYSSLTEADLSDANLHSAVLSNATLTNATLRDADLSNVDLWSADLTGANLSSASLDGASLGKANLRGADLSKASLNNADLSDTITYDTNLSGADLSSANRITEEQLEAAKSLDGATMPNGQKYEEWLKSKD